MSEELIQRNLIEIPEKIGSWNYYNIGATSLRSLRNAKLIPDCDYSEYEDKKPDAIIVKKPVVIAVIEYKQPKELRDKKQIQKAIKQEIDTAQILKAKIYIVTDGTKSFWINPVTGNQILDEAKTPISTNFNKNSPDIINLINKIISSISSTNDEILPSTTVDPLPLAQKIWQDLWSVSGATPENCLYTFVEIFIFKYLSDLGVLRGIHSFSHTLDQYTENNENEMLEFYASTVRVKIKDLFPGNRKDNTTIINGTIFVSKDDKAVSGYGSVFKKILKRFNDFGSLENIDYDFKSKLFETFLKESISKKNWGQYFTPLKVVRSIVSMADIKPGLKVCDPACGVGKFLLEPILHDMSRFFEVRNNKIIPHITLVGLDKGFDKDEQKTIILAKANMLIYMSNLIRENGDITEQFAELFNNTFTLQTNSILGTLAKPIKDEYDLILTNPPYVMSGSSNIKEEIAKSEELKNHFSINAMGIEGLFVEWIVRALKPEGRAFVVVPDGIMNRGNDKRLRDFILDECILDAVISLPLNTFFTTNKKTYIMALTKKAPITSGGVTTKERQILPVFTYLCSEIGESRDVYRFDIEQNDLDTATTLYNMFKGARERFTTVDKRCKIVSIDEFYNGSHWSVERWWTREEKIELGIEDENEIISIEDFISMINDLSSSLIEFEEPLRELLKKKSELRLREIRVSEIFDLTQTTNNSEFTKTFINNNPGNIPVYGASKDGDNASYGYIKEGVQDVKYFEDCLTWNIDGSLGLFLRKGKFSLSEKVIPLIVRDAFAPYMSLEFLRFAILTEAQKNPFSYTNKGGKTRLGNIKIKVPAEENGTFDITKQEAIAEQFRIINELKSEVEQKHQEIAALKFTVDFSDYTMVDFTLSDVLEPLKGKSTYTKNYGDNHKGEYPVFSASAYTPLTYIDSFDYDGSYLSWSANGFAGTTIVLNGKFSINGDRGILLPKKDKVDIQYLKYILEPIFRKLAKGRKGDRGKDEFTKLYSSMLSNVVIPIPVSSDGFIDIEAQKEIANKYLIIEQYKQDIIRKLDIIQQRKLVF